MMEKKGFKLLQFLLAIFLIVASVVALKNPLTSTKWLVIYIAISAIFSGLIKIFAANIIKDATGYRTKGIIILGIISLLTGFFLLFNYQYGIIAMPFVIAIWFISDSISGILSANKVKETNKNYYWFTLFTDAIGIIFGIILLFNPFVALFIIDILISIYLLTFGITYLIDSFN